MLPPSNSGFLPHTMLPSGECIFLPSPTLFNSRNFYILKNTWSLRVYENGLCIMLDITVTLLFTHAPPVCSPTPLLFVHPCPSCLFTHAPPVCSPTPLLFIHPSPSCLFTHAPPVCSPMPLLFVHPRPSCLFTQAPPVCSPMPLLFVHPRPSCLITHAPLVCSSTALLFVHPRPHMMYNYQDLTRFNKSCHPSQRPRWQVDKEAIGLSRVQQCSSTYSPPS